MKKFLILSAIVGLAGLGVGIAGSQSPESTVVESAADAPVTSTATPAAAAVTSSTVAKVATKAPAKAVATTTTRPAGASSPATVAAPVTTTTLAPTTTTTAVTAVTPTCTVSAAPAAAGSYIGGGYWEDVRIVSNMPKTRTRLTVQYPTRKQQFWLTTDAGGAAKKIFPLSNESGTTGVSVDFYDAAENHVGGSPACSGSFMSTSY